MSRFFRSNNKDTFDKKVQAFANDYLRVCRYLVKVQNPDKFFPQKLIGGLVSEALLLEEFLDWYGAKNNNQWYFFRELCAAMLHIGNANKYLTYLVYRLDSYELPNIGNFKDNLEKYIVIINKMMITISKAVIEECVHTGLKMPAGTLVKNDFPEVMGGTLLDFDIDDEDKDVQRKNIVRNASEFLNISRDFEYFQIYRQCDAEKMRELVPASINEVNVRRFEMLIHNLQSQFDSYIIQGGFRRGNQRLKQLRSYYSVIFRCLQVTGALLHFYERHLKEDSYKHVYKETRTRFYEMLDVDEILDAIVNFGVLSVSHFFTVGVEHAQQILNEFIERGSITVGIPRNRGFHSRPSLMVAKIVQHYGGEVELIVGDHRFDASSVLDIQWAGGKIQKEEITEVVFEGDARALHDIEILAQVNYGEDTMGKGVPLPDELAYLR